MLECLYITKSRIRQDLMTVFFTDPPQRHYLRELQRLLGYSAGSIRRELLTFQKAGLLTTDRIGNLLFYSANSRHFLFKEFRSIVSKTIGVEGSLMRALSHIPGITAAFIPGPSVFRKGEPATATTLVIIGDPPKAILNKKITGLEKRLSRKITAMVYSPQEYRLLKREGNSSLADMLNGPRVMLVGAQDDV